MKFKNSQRGFTIVELMVVVAIIGILSGIIITNLTSSKSKSRDAQRVSDVNQIQLALEQYFDRCGQYPIPTGTSNGQILLTANNGCPSGITFSSYISVIPNDPVSKTQYGYIVNSSALPTDYILHASLENSNNAQQNSYSETVRSGTVTGSWSGDTFSCFNSIATVGQPGYLDYCVSTK